LKKTNAVFIAIALLMLTVLTVIPSGAFAQTENTWETKSTIPLSVNGFKAVSVGDNIFLFSKDATYVYNVNTGSWAQKTAMLTPRTDFAIAVYQDKVYTIGGQYTWHPADGSDHGYPTDVNEVYDTKSDTWQMKKQVNDTASRMQGATFDGEIYVLTGRNLEAYNPASDSWTIKTSTIKIAPMVVLDNKLVLVDANLQIYDPEANSWWIGAVLPNSYSGQGVAVTSGVYAPQKIYAMGGNTIHEFGYSIATDANYVYDPSSNSWSEAAPMPTARFGSVVAVFNDKIYVLGGALTGEWFSDNVSKAVEVYTPFGYSTTPLQTSTPTTSYPTFLAVIVGAVIAGTVIAVTVVTILYFKRAPSKTSKPT
jgi:hypothetical protein